MSKATNILDLCTECATNLYGSKPPNSQYTQQTINLLFGTCAAESAFKDRRQKNFSLNAIEGAWGLWQCEEIAMIDYLSYLRRSPTVRKNFARFIFNGLNDDLEGILNMGPYSLLKLVHDWDRLAVAFARLHYFRFPQPIPVSIEDQAEYWKKYYNTHLGSGTTEKYLTAWRQLCLPHLNPQQHRTQ